MSRSRCASRTTCPLLPCPQERSSAHRHDRALGGGQSVAQVVPGRVAHQLADMRRASVVGSQGRGAARSAVVISSSSVAAASAPACVNWSSLPGLFPSNVVCTRSLIVGVTEGREPDAGRGGEAVEEARTVLARDLFHSSGPGSSPSRKKRPGQPPSRASGPQTALHRAPPGPFEASAALAPAASAWRAVRRPSAAPRKRRAFPVADPASIN